MDRSSGINIKDKSTFSAPTPQNTPSNPPLLNTSYRPSVSAINENMEIIAAAGGQMSAIDETLPAAVKRCVNYLKYLQSKHAELEGQLQEEILALEKKYLELYRPWYEKRKATVTGQYEPTDQEVELGKKTEDDSDGEEEEGDDKNKAGTTPAKDADEEEAPAGIPEFWLTALKNHPQISEIITEADEAALKHLVDIRMSYMDKPGFQLEFEFEPNEYFDNQVLSKTYFYREQLSGGDFVYGRAEGTKVDWKANKDLTVTFEKRKQRHKGTNQTRVVKRTVPKDSFFAFFAPPLYDDNDELDEEEAEALDEKLEADYEMGEEFKDKIIPFAVHYFTGKALEYEDFDGDDDLEGDFYDDDDDEDEEDEDEDDDDDDEDEQPANGGKAPECKQQ